MVLYTTRFSNKHLRKHTFREPILVTGFKYFVELSEYNFVLHGNLTIKNLWYICNTGDFENRCPLKKTLNQMDHFFKLAVR